jgi:hypothetical protein
MVEFYSCAYYVYEMMENDVDDRVGFYYRILQIYTGYHMGLNLGYMVQITYWISHEHVYKGYSGTLFTETLPQRLKQILFFRR